MKYWDGLFSAPKISLKANPIVDNPEMHKCNNNNHQKITILITNIYWVPMVCQALSYMSICSHSFVPYTIITPFYGRKNSTLEKLSNFSKVTQPSNGKLGFKPGSLTERLSTQKCFFDSWFSPCKQSGKRQLHDKNLDITTIIIIITIITANRDLCHCVRGTAQNAQKTKRH